MKKKGIWLVVALAALLVAGALFFTRGGRDTGSSEAVASFVPENALALVTLNHLDQMADGFAATPLGHFFAKDTMHAILDDLKADAVRKDYDQLFDSIAQTLNDRAFRAVFGDDLTVVLLPPDMALLRDNPKLALQRSVATYATTQGASLASLLGNLVKGVTIEKETVDGLELNRIQVTDSTGRTNTFYGYGEGNVLLLALDKAPVLAGVKAKKGGANFQAQSGYREAVAFWQKESAAAPMSTSYYNIAGMAALLPQLDTLAGGEKKRQDFAKLATYASGIDYAYDVAFKSAKGLESKSRIKTRYDALHELVRNSVDISLASDSSPLSFLGEQSLLFYWITSWTPENLLKLVAEEDPEDYAKFQTQVQGVLGIPPEEAASSFGPRYGLVLNDIVQTKVSPMPDVAIFANVRNRANVEKLAGSVNQIVAPYGIAGTQQQLDQARLYTWPVMNEVGLVPSLGVDDHMLVLGAMQKTVQPLLAKSGRTGTLPQELMTILGTEMSADLTRANNAAVVFRPAKLAAKSQPLLTMLTSTTGRESVLSREVIKLIQSTEVMASACTVGKEQAEFHAMWVPVAQDGTGAAAH